MENILMFLLVLLIVDTIIAGGLIDSGHLRLGYQLKHFGEHELIMWICISAVLALLEILLV